MTAAAQCRVCRGSQGPGMCLWKGRDEGLVLTQQPGGSGGGEGTGGANCGSLAGRATVATLLTAAGPNPGFLCAPSSLPPRPVSPLPSCGQHTAVPHSACLTQPQTAGNHMPLFPRAFAHCVVQQGVLLA